jgi:hypothetical protein
MRISLNKLPLHKLPLLAALLITVFAAAGRAEMTRIDVTSREDVLHGKPFGAAGPYERIIGKAFFAVDPKNPRNQIVPNIDKAPRNAQGMVEFSADVYLLVPKDQSKGNGVAFFEVPNRGRREQMIRFDRVIRGAPETPETEFGDGLLLNSGYTLVSVGWQYSLARNGQLIGVDLPPALENSGLVRTPLAVNRAAPTLALDPDAARYPPLDLNSPKASLTVRQNVYDAPRTIPRDQWQFAKVVNGQVVPDGTSLYMKEGFQPGQTYELSYEGKGAVIGGLGYVAQRDAASAFKYKQGFPVSVKYAYALGESQTGRFVREFIYRGYNADERNRRSFDLLWAHIGGAARGDFVQPFSLPNGLGVFTGSMFPYSDVPQKDPVTGKTDGMLMHMSKETIPKIVYTNGDCEYWGGGRAAALIDTSLDGKKDLKMPDNVRVYLLAGTQHLPSAFPPRKGAGQQRPNPNDYTWALRALLVGVDQWVRQGTLPPPSRYPKLSDGTLVPHAGFQFPAVPSVQSPAIIPGGYRADLGGPASPRIPFLVPQVDADGNDVGGIRLPEIAVPLGTYTGWNFRSPESGAPTEIIPLNGAFIPFPRTRAEREKTHDPRPSIEERYSSRDAYLAKVKEAAEHLVSERYLLPADVDPVVSHAGALWDYVAAPAP